jgi:hypothetical protein
MAMNFTAVCVLPAMVLLRARNGTAAVFPLRFFYLEAGWRAVGSLRVEGRGHPEISDGFRACWANSLHARDEPHPLRTPIR